VCIGFGTAYARVASDGSHYEKRGNDEPVCIDDEIPFEIPENWEWCRLGTLCSKIGSGSTPSGGRNVYKEEGPLLIRSQNVYDDGLKLEGVAHFDSALYESRKSHVLPKDVLLNITGASIGRCAIVPDEFGDADINQHVLILRQVDQNTREYVHLAITSPAVQEAIMSSQVGATKEGLSATKASELLIPIPPLAEQPKIVAQVGASLKMVEDYGVLENSRESLDSNLSDRLRKSVLQQAVQGKLVPQDPDDEPASVLLERIRAERRKLVAAGKAKAPKGGESVIYRASDGGYYEKRGKDADQSIEIPFEIPDTWCWTRLNQLGEIVGGGTPKTHDDSLWGTANGGIPWVTPADMKNIDGMFVSHGSRYLSAKGLDSSSAQLLPAGSVLMSSRAPIGYLGIAARPLATNQGFKSVAPVLSSLNGWIICALEALMDDIKARASGTTFKEISGTEFGETLIPVPPMNEQRRIVEKASSVINHLG
jgi:type I restriction enzyme S subunit